MQKPKGLVFITLDCARYDRMSFNGYKFIKHFNMEWFAKRGYVFENMISVGAQTPQVHASFLTGKYQFEHGLRRMYGSKLNPAVKTIPEQLLEQGWTTACATGFQGLCKHYGLGRGFEQIDEDSDISKSWGDNANGGAKGNDWREWVKDFKYDEEKPLFIWLHYFFGHKGSDKVLPKRYQKNNFKNDMFANYDRKFLWFDEEWLPGITERFDPKDFAYIITADHGDDFGKYESGHSSYLYHETIHVPMIWYSPTKNFWNYEIPMKNIMQPTNTVPEFLNEDFGMDIKYSKLPMAYSETLMDYDCGLGDGSGKMREKCFRHSICDEKTKAIYKNPDKLGIGELEEITFIEDGEEYGKQQLVDEFFDKSGYRKYLEMPEILNPVYEAGMDEDIKSQLTGLGYMQ